MPATFKVGRSTSNDVVIQDGTVSRSHGVLSIDDDGVITFLDLDSTGGSYVIDDDRLSPVRDRKLSITNELFLGAYRISVADLLDLAEKSDLNAKVVSDAPLNGRLEVEIKGSRTAPTPPENARVRRDPKTGRIIRSEQEGA